MSGICPNLYAITPYQRDGITSAVNCLAKLNDGISALCWRREVGLRSPNSEGNNQYSNNGNNLK